MLDDDYCTEVDGYIERLKKCEYITEKEVKKLCEKAKELLTQDENVIYLSSPITVLIN
jgi:serine/threonine-protein phosphatase 4 catalytic subunit